MKPQLAVSLTLGALMLLASAAPASAQGAGPRTVAGCVLEPVKFHACALEKMKTFNPPRTRDGVPDMRGHWDRIFPSQNIEEHEADALNTQAGSSIVVDTPDRKIPYQPWALELRNSMVARYISPLAACFPPGIPRYAIAPGAHQILQSAGQVVHLLEFSHSYRIVPIGSTPHVPASVRLWLGDSRGRWEGNTLVIDVRNTNGWAWIDNAGNFFSDALRVTERFTFIDADTIHYEARMEDPKVYTRPWTMVSGLTRNKQPGFELLEQACHEGNRSIEGGIDVGLKLYEGVTPPAR